MSSDAADIYRPPSPPVIASKFCDSCNTWTDHFTEGHESEDLPSRESVRVALQEARNAITTNKEQ